MQTMSVIWGELYQHVQYWQKNNTKSDTTDCVLNCTLTMQKKRKVI